jgi:hypothetical protein
MPTFKLTAADSIKARELSSEYQRQHDLAGRKGDTAGIDVFSGRVWLGKSIADVVSQRDAEGIEMPLYFERVGSPTYLRKVGRRRHVKC